jgi:hypothetical protein
MEADIFAFISLLLSKSFIKNRENHQNQYNPEKRQNPRQLPFIRLGLE